MSDLFRPVGPGEDYHLNAMLTHREDDGWLGQGYVSAADALVQHWVEHGPNDLLLVPIIMNYRHGIELLLKDAIRNAAECLWQDGKRDPDLYEAELDKWLSRFAGHKLQILAGRLDDLLHRLREEQLPAETHETLMRIHELDPTGETFRYATSWSKDHKKFVPSQRPSQSHINVVAMGREFHKVASLIGDGVGTILDLYREYQAEYREDCHGEY
jgi:hypothetical protein